MDLMYIMFSYKRLKTMSVCLESLFNGSKTKPELMYILDDHSDAEHQHALVNLSQEYSEKLFPIHVLCMGKNMGIGHNFSKAYELMKYHNPRLCYFLEADYLMRNEFHDDIEAVFAASPSTIAIPLTSHPDMDNPEKYNNEFPKIMIDLVGEDVKARPYFYKPFDLETKRGKIRVRGISNSCGCHVLHYQRLKDIWSENQTRYYNFWENMDKAFFSQDNGWSASDGQLSSNYTWAWEQWALENNIDLSTNFAWLDIEDYSVGQHLCCLGRNGMIPGAQELQTFVGSKSFPKDWQTWTRKLENV